MNRWFAPRACLDNTVETRPLVAVLSKRHAAEIAEMKSHRLMVIRYWKREGTSCILNFFPITSNE
jgi:hypothetical protein